MERMFCKVSPLPAVMFKCLPTESPRAHISLFFRPKEQIQCFPLPPEGSCTWDPQPPRLEVNACCTQGDAVCVMADDSTHTCDTHGISFGEDLFARNGAEHHRKRCSGGRLWLQACCITCDGCPPFETMSFIVGSPQTRTLIHACTLQRLTFFHFQ